MIEEFIYFPAADNSKHFWIEIAGISYCDETYKIHRKKSGCMVIEYVIEGQGIVILDNQKYEVKAGDVYILPSGHEHLYYSDKHNPWIKIWFNAKGTIIDILLREYNPRNLVVFEGTDGSKYIKRIHEIGKNPFYSADEKHQKAALVVHEMLQYLYCEFYGRKVQISENVTKMKDYLERHISKNVSLKELGNLVYLSESQVIRCFKKDLGITPHEYIMNLKFEQAENLLCNTGLMIREIAEYLGFCDEHYFSYVFKTRTGKTPTEYRKNAGVL